MRFSGLVAHLGEWAFERAPAVQAHATSEVAGDDLVAVRAADAIVSAPSEPSHDADTTTLERRPIGRPDELRPMETDPSRMDGPAAN